MEFTGERLVPGKGGNELQVEHEHRYHVVAPLLSGMNVLDAACGAGYGSEIIARYAKSTTGVDLSADAIKYAKKHYKTPKFVEASVDSMPFKDDEFDAVVSFETIEHIDEATQHRFLDEVARVMKTGGLFIISTVNKAVYTDKQNHSNEYHIKEYYLPEFKKLLEKRFKNVEFFIQSFGVYSSILNEESREAKILGEITGSSDSNGMYVIAVCTNGKDEHNLSSMLYYCQDYETYFTDGVMWKQRYSELNKELEERTQWALRLDKENTSYEVKLSEWVSKNNVIDQQNNELTQQANMLIQQNNDLIQHNGDLMQDNKNLTQQNSDLTQNNSNLTQHCASLVSRNNELAQHNEELAQNCEDMLNQNKELSQLNEEIEQHCEEEKNKNSELTRQKSDLEQHCERIENHNRVQEQKNNELTQTVELITSQNAELSQTVDNLTHQIAEINNSTTWKIGHRINRIFRFFIPYRGK
ncbi:MAG: methyltransferase domain-containing protein [Oscillospiraceae bacterium]|nr:methyltransferase domain-containing protein [Oscillospiraceae bacterium]